MECTVFNLNVTYNHEQTKQLKIHIWKFDQFPQSTKWLFFIGVVMYRV